MSRVWDDHVHANQLASDWMHRGIDLLKKNSGISWLQAVRCFDEAIALRRTLPLEENPFFRYGLSAGWINRGDALARLGESSSVDRAVESYDEALALLESLPLEENILYPRRLAITWINRGCALQQKETPAGQWEAVQCFREAIDVLGSPSSETISDRSVLLAGAWINLAGALDNSGKGDAGDVHMAAHQALELVRLSEYSEQGAANVGLKARHLLCRRATKQLLEKKHESRIVIQEATDWVDEAMTLVRHWKLEGSVERTRLARDIFRFGCRLYADSQPHFLREFLVECCESETVAVVILSDREAFDAARAAIWSTMEALHLDGFQAVATNRFEPYLAEITRLRLVEERLGQLRAEQAIIKN